MPDYLWATEESTLRRAALGPLWLAEGPYRLGVWLHRQLYLRGARRRIRLPAQVVSVGNLAVGGSGKTPLVAWLARELRARGRKPALLSRGVRGRLNARVNVVSDGQRVLLSPADVGDEPVLLAGAVPGVPVLAGRNRAALGFRAASLFGAEILVLDDGFQHHRLERDVDLVCIDAELGLGNRHVLPRGPLREPESGLRRAHAIVWTRAPRAFAVPGEVPGLPAGTPQFAVQMAPRELRPLAGGPARPVQALEGQRVGLFAAIARPDRLARELTRMGAAVVAVRRFPDHHLYERRDLEALDRGLSWVTTAKDAVKLPAAWLSGLRVDVLEEEVSPLEPLALIDWVVDRLDDTRRPE